MLFNLLSVSLVIWLRSSVPVSAEKDFESGAMTSTREPGDCVIGRGEMP